MKLGWIVAGALAGVASAAGVAPAQTPADIQRLDRWSAERSTARGPVAPLSPPPAAPERLQTLRRLWVCMGTPQGRPVYASPDTASRVIGTTMPFVATAGGYVDGFAQVLHTNGQLGYVPAAEVGPFRSAANPSAQCRVLGVRSNGSPVFDIR